MLLLPFAASAHNDNGLRLGSLIGKGNLTAEVKADIKHNNDRKDRHDDDKKERKATTTAATITAKATRTVKAADFMASLSPVLATRIAGAGLTASSTADANVKLAAYNTAVTGAKTQANAAITVAAQINTTNSTTTNATLLDTAKAKLKAAHECLLTAQKNFKLIVRLIING